MTDEAVTTTPAMRIAHVYQQHPLWQTFTDSHVEQDYQRTFETEMRAAILFSSLLAVFLYPLFGVLDYYSTPDYKTFWLYRGVLGWLPLIALFLLAWRNKFSGYYQRYSFLVAVCSGTAVLLMIYHGNEMVRQHYPYGLILVVIFAAIPFFIRFLWVVILALILFCGFTVSTLLQYRQTADLLANYFIICCSLVLTTAGSFYIEKFFRGNYVTRQLEIALLNASEAANKAKSDFIAVVSHELRTPLTVIKGNSRIVSGELFGVFAEQEEMYKQMMAEVSDSADHLLAIIQDLLEVSKAEAGKLEMELTAFDMIAEVRDIAHQMQQYQQEIPFTLVVQTTLENIVITADKRRLRQVWMNLLSNAIKFNKPQGMIVVGVALQGDVLVCSVTDEGIGIALKDQQRIFEPFEQAGDILKRRQDGTGLGLPFVKSVVEAHGGRIELNSVLGEGTTVRFFLPLSVLSAH
jgi:signal transduction histidine kinase